MIQKLPTATPTQAPVRLAHHTLEHTEEQAAEKRAAEARGVDRYQPQPVVLQPKGQAKGKTAEKILLGLGYSSMAALVLGFPVLSLAPVVGGAMIIGGSVGTVLCGFGLLINHRASQR